VEVDLDVVGTWIGEDSGIPAIDGASVALVRERVRAEAARVGLAAVPAAALVNVASELAHNQVAHARGGRILVREARRGEQRGLEIVAADSGPGIADVARALEGRPSERGSLGVGLAAVFELADEVDVDVRIHEGTCVWARKFEGTAPERRPRIGIYGRPFPHEMYSGDDASFVRQDDRLVLGVVDGLGHGEPARQASVLAARLLLSQPDTSPGSLLSACDRRLAGTRGAVMTAAVVDTGGKATVAGVGNVGARIYGPGHVWRFGGSSFFLGSATGAGRVTVEEERIERRDVLVLFSDGIRSSMDLSRELDLLREHPVVVAQRIVERFGRADDDVMVMVAG
jgi:anti-sigma regulatory factor (Ser/Thr protein kinase)